MDYRCGDADQFILMASVLIIEHYYNNSLSFYALYESCTREAASHPGIIVGSCETLPPESRVAPTRVITDPAHPGRGRL
jgi:hypothetical protein